MSTGPGDELLGATESLYRGLVEGCGELVAIVDDDATFVFVNGACEALLGFERSELLGRELGHVVALEPESWVELAFFRGEQQPCVLRRQLTARRKDAAEVAVSLTATRAPHDPNCLVVVIADASQTSAAREELERLAYTDELTGLPNRRSFLASLGDHLEYGRRYGHRGAVLMLDLDRFKAVNDRLGHPAGDQLLRQVARRLEAGSRATDRVARLHGDEFVVLLPEADASAAGRAAELLLDDLWDAPFAWASAREVISASVGIALIDRDFAVDEILALANQGLHRAKRAGRRRVAFARFEPRDGIDRTSDSEVRDTVSAAPGEDHPRPSPGCGDQAALRHLR